MIIKHYIRSNDYSRRSNKLIKTVQDTIYNVAAKYLKTLGWTMNDIADYFYTEIEQIEPNKLRVELRGELNYEELEGLCKQLDKVIADKFDKYAYFEPVTSGIAEAYIRTNINSSTTIQASAKQSITIKDIQNLIDKYGTRYFEATPTSSGKELFFTVFDVGSYSIRVENDKIIMVSTDDPHDDVRIFRTLDDLNKYLERQISIVKQSTDTSYSANSATGTCNTTNSSTNSHNERIVADSLSDAYDAYLQPPDDDLDTVPEDDQIYEVQLSMDKVLVTVYDDGSWEYDDIDWAKNPDNSTGDYYSDDGVLVVDYGTAVSDLDTVLEPFMPAYVGKYQISGYGLLVYNISGLEAIYDSDPFADDGADKTVIIDNAEVSLDLTQSSVTDFSYSKMED